MTSLNDIKQSAEDISNDSRQKWCDFAWTIRNYVISVLGDLPDTVICKGWVIQSICSISETYKVKHGNIESLKMVQLLYGLFMRIVDKVEEIKRCDNIAEIQIVDLATIISLAEFLHSLNPRWNIENWVSACEITFNLMLNQIAARRAHEWHLDVQYQEAILNQFKMIADVLDSSNSKS